MRGPLLCGFQSSSARTPARPTTTSTTTLTTTTTNGIAMMRRASARAWRNACSAPRRHRCGRGYDDASYYSSIRVVGNHVSSRKLLCKEEKTPPRSKGKKASTSREKKRLGKRPSGKPVRSPPFNREVYSSSKVCDRACNLGRCCAFRFASESGFAGSQRAEIVRDVSDKVRWSARARFG